MRRPIRDIAATAGDNSVDLFGGFTYSPDASYRGPDSFTYKASDFFNDSAPALVSLTVAPDGDTPANTPPSNLSLDLAAAINENGTTTLNGTFTDPDAADTHAVVINWGSGEGTTTLNLAAGVLTFGASHQYLDDYPSGTPCAVYPVSVTVTDDDTGSATAAASLTVNNVAPQVGPLTGPRGGTAVTGTSFSGVRGQAMAFAAAFNAIGTLDTHSVSWNFGDGTSTGLVPASATGALAPFHAYSAAGAYSLSFTVRDDDGGQTTVPAVVTVLDAEMQVDPCDDGLRALVVAGTDGGDMMLIRPSCGGTVEVVLNGKSLGSFTPTGRILAYGLGGDDNIQVAGSIGRQVWLYGDAGNDRMNAGNGGSLLIGGDENDQLLGNGGRDVMIGGEGADRIVGNSNDDILVAGYTTMDDRSVPGHSDFWCAVLDEWNSANTFTARVRNLKDGLAATPTMAPPSCFPMFETTALRTPSISSTAPPATNG